MDYVIPQRKTFSMVGLIVVTLFLLSSYSIYRPDNVTPIAAEVSPYIIVLYGATFWFANFALVVTLLVYRNTKKTVLSVMFAFPLTPDFALVKKTLLLLRKDIEKSVPMVSAGQPIITAIGVVMTALYILAAALCFVGGMRGTAIAVVLFVILAAFAKASAKKLIQLYNIMIDVVNRRKDLEGV